MWQTVKSSVVVLLVAVTLAPMSTIPLRFVSETGQSHRYVEHMQIPSQSHLPSHFDTEITAGSNSTIWDRVKCVACKVVVEAVQLGFDLGQSPDTVAKAVVKICKRLHIEDSRVCVGIVHMFKDEVMAVISGLVLSPDQICGAAFGKGCAKTYWPFSQWNVTLPDTPKPPVRPHVLPKSDSPTMRVLHLTDIHLDQLYIPGSKAECSEPLCCRAIDGKPGPGEKGAGRYGDYRHCDTPEWTLNQLFATLSQQHFDYILWTGDLPAHNVWNQTKEAQSKLLSDLTRLMNQYFPNTPIFPSVGNHESSPVNSFPPRTITGKNSIAWLYNALVFAWSTWLPPHALESVRNVGYYTINPFPGFRIISLNSNACNRFNWWLYLNTTDPDGQLAWLIDNLQSAEDNKEKVHIIGHIPPGAADCLKYWSYNYYQIVDRYESTITGQFFGHTHNDHFEVFYDEATRSRATSVAYISPSITPYTGLNMGYRVFTIDGNYSDSSWEVLDHETYVLDLAQANTGHDPPMWNLEYSAKADLNMKSLFPEDWDDVISRAEKDNKLLQKLNRFFYKSHTDEPCDAECAKELLCGMKSARTDSEEEFCGHLSPATTD